MSTHYPVIAHDGWAASPLEPGQRGPQMPHVSQRARHRLAQTHPCPSRSPPSAKATEPAVGLECAQSSPDPRADKEKSWSHCVGSELTKEGDTNHME